jgi:hypothetical protein
MPRVRCRYRGCVYLIESYCTASDIEFDPNMGCLNFSRSADIYDEDWVDDDDDIDTWLHEDSDDGWLDEDDV